MGEINSRFAKYLKEIYPFMYNVVKWPKIL